MEKFKKYWETEPKIVADTGANRLEYYPAGEYLNICKADTQGKDGTIYHGKTVGLNLASLRKCPQAIEIIKDIASNLE